MGKLKKTNHEEKGQAKISSFFNNAPPRSQLFTTVSSSRQPNLSGASAVKASASASTTEQAEDDDVLVIESSPLSEKYKPVQQKTSRIKDVVNNKERKTSSLSLDFTKHGGKIDPHSTANNEGKQKHVAETVPNLSVPRNDEHVICIPETQYIEENISKNNPLNTERCQNGSKYSGSLSKDYNKIHSSCQLQKLEKPGSPGNSEEKLQKAYLQEDMIIPDTPDPLAKYSNPDTRKKRTVGRSFLSSSSFLKLAHQGPVEKVITGKRSHPSVYNKGRSFEDAYKEIENARHGDKGTLVGDGEEGMQSIMQAMGLQDLSVGKPRATLPPSSLSQDKQDEQLAIEKLAKPDDSKLLSALGETNPEESSKNRKPSIMAQICGVKRPSTGGVSPNPKRPTKNETRSADSTCRRNLSTSSHRQSVMPNNKNTSGLKHSFKENTENKSKGKADSWDSTLKLCDNDNMLQDILSEMKTSKGHQCAIKSLESQVKVPLKTVDTNSPEKAAAIGMDLDIDPDLALDDIIKELQSTLPTNVSYIETESLLDQSLEHTRHAASSSDEDPAAADAGSGQATTENCKSPALKKQVKTEHARNKVSVSSTAPCSAFGRHSVTAVEKSRDGVKLKVVSDPGNEHRVVMLQGSWMDSHVGEGDVINVVGDFNTDGCCHIKDSANYLIVHPDSLLSGTSVVSAVYCMRKSVLNERFRGYEGKNVHMLYGCIIHSLFQEVLNQKVKSLAAVQEIAKSLLQENRTLHDIYSLGLHENAVMEEIEKYLPKIIGFLEEQTMYDNSLKIPNQDKPLITKIADIEENIWSPRYGIKGKVDLSVNVKYKHGERGWINKLVPLELKTGKPSFSVEHRGQPEFSTFSRSLHVTPQPPIIATDEDYVRKLKILARNLLQVMLYTMMMGDRGPEPDEGLLLYLKDGSMSSVPASYLNKKGLVQLRNEFAHHMQKTLQASRMGDQWNGGLPPPINNPRSCSKCPQLLNCTLYNRTLEGSQLPEGHPISELTGSSLQHLLNLHVSYYAHWVRLLHLEIGVTRSHSVSSKDLWCKSAEQREQDGHGIAGVLLDKAGSSDKADITGNFLQMFVRDGHGSLQDIGVCKGDQVVVSAHDKPLLALAMGAVVSLNHTSVTLSLDRNMKKYEQLLNERFRLDKVDFHSAMNTNFNNLTRLMEDNPRSGRLRAVVVEKKRPEFSLTMAKGTIEKVKHIFKSLNKPQKSAILKVLMCKDYVLIKGYPGTGKTSTIVALVRILVTLGQSVLLASYTHSAVDNILLKLTKFNDVDFLRLGRLERVHSDIKPFAAENQSLACKSADDIQQLYHSKPVIATTCLGVTHSVFTRRVFDICIVDEASQVLQPACLGPLFASRRFILVGDPLQLPPVVQNKEARDAGMAESLFARLDDTGATYELNVQYRMNKEIMRLSNELVYKGALQCGTASVASSRLVFPSPHKLLSIEVPWLKLAVSNAEGHEVVFLDTSQVVQNNDSSESGIINTHEANIALQIVEYCLKGGIEEHDLGVITPFRKQVQFMRDLFRSQGHQGVEVNTVDQYQGRDKDLIIVSLVKTQGHESEILRDMRRLNVALTRAKHKLIMIGSASNLKAFQPIEQLLRLLQPHQIISVTDEV